MNIIKWLLHPLIIIYLLSIITDISARTQPKNHVNDIIGNQTLYMTFDEAIIDFHFLEKTIAHFTNIERKKHNLMLCQYDNKLQAAAFRHSLEMMQLQYFSHISPVKKNKVLITRLKQAGYPMSNVIIGENIGVDYLLRIAGKPFYISYLHGEKYFLDAKTHQPIGSQTYIEFARNMVNHWMNSPPHRKNMLNHKFNQIGVGIAKGPYQGTQAFYVTQNFGGPLVPEYQIQSTKKIDQFNSD